MSSLDVLQKAKPKEAQPRKEVLLPKRPSVEKREKCKYNKKYDCVECEFEGCPAWGVGWLEESE